MKNKHILLIAFVLSTLRAASLNLKEAIARKQVAIEVTGSNYDSMPLSFRSDEFRPSMQMRVSNLSNQEVEIELEPGYMLEATEPGYQAMLLVQSVGMKLRPNGRQLQFLYAMCTEFTKSGPNPTLHYNVAEKAKPALLQLARFIASKKYWGHAAQHAVWSLSDDMPITSIDDNNPVVQNDLQKETASIKGVNIAALTEEYEKRKEDYNRRRGADMAAFDGEKLDRNLTFSVNDTAMVSVGFYDTHGHLIRPVFTNRLFREGKHSVRYNPYPLALAGKQYAVRMIKDGALYKEYNFMQ